MTFDLNGYTFLEMQKLVTLERWDDDGREIYTSETEHRHTPVNSVMWKRLDSFIVRLVCEHITLML